MASKAPIQSGGDTMGASPVAGFGAGGRLAIIYWMTCLIICSASFDVACWVLTACCPSCWVLLAVLLFDRVVELGKCVAELFTVRGELDGVMKAFPCFFR